MFGCFGCLVCVCVHMCVHVGGRRLGVCWVCLYVRVCVFVYDSHGHARVRNRLKGTDHIHRPAYRHPLCTKPGYLITLN